MFAVVNGDDGVAKPSRRLDRSIVGAVLGTSTVTVTAPRTAAYARATNDENPAYLQGDDVIAPPVYQVALAALAMPKAVMDGMGLDVVGERIGLHAEQDMRFIAPIVPGETIVTDARVEAVEDHRLGEMARIATASRTVHDEDRCRSRMSILFIDRSYLQSGRGRPVRAASPAPPTATSQTVVQRDQSLRYAEASGDHTRPHVDEDFARSLGYPGYLLQGLCTMAFASKAVVDQFANGDPRRLRRLSVRFSGPVFPGDVLTTTMWRTAQASVIALETANAQGFPVISRGIAEI